MSTASYPDIPGARVLATPMDPGANDASAATVQDYLVELLSSLWEQGEGFSGKRPFGSSGWEFELHMALGRAGLIDMEVDEDGDAECDEVAGRFLISRAIDALRICNQGVA